MVWENWYKAKMFKHVMLLGTYRSSYGHEQST